MRKFDLHASENFKGSQFFDSFETDSVDDFYEQLISYWDHSGLTKETGEIFVYTDVEYEGKIYSFQVGYYCLDGEEIYAMCNVPDNDNKNIDNLISQSIVGSFDDRNDETACFIQLVEGLLK